MLTKEISDLEQEKHSLEENLIKVDLSNTKELTDLGLKLDQVTNELEAKMQKWIQLEEAQ